MTSKHKSRTDAILARGTYRELTRIEKILTTETTGGLILVGATILALLLANSPAADAYFSLRDMHVGFSTSWLDLDLSLAHWAADGLLAIFFFLVGLELKMELTKGDLRDPRRNRHCLRRRGPRNRRFEAPRGAAHLPPDPRDRR